MTVDIPKFVVTAGPDGLNALMDIDTNYQLDAHPLAGVTGTFTPNLKPGLYPIGGGLHLVEPIPFTIDSDGKINGDSGIELVAAIDGVAHLQWNISFDRAYLNGKLLGISGWWFNARDDGETVPLQELVSVQKSPATWIGGGRPAFPLAGGAVNEAGGLVLHNSDGSLLTPITPAEGTLIIVRVDEDTVLLG